MTTGEVKEKYLKFFVSSPRSHKEVSSSPIVLEGDPTTLFVSSGMQPLIAYLKGEKHPNGKRLVNSQPSIRLQDIEEVGDGRHITYFEMLGNWSLGDYFKQEQIPWYFDFLTKELALPKERLWVSVFEGDDFVPRDIESFEIWKKLGVAEKRIHFYGVAKNWWSRSGAPSQMPEGEIGGPDSEVFFEFQNINHDPKFGSKCHPNCDCGKFLEIGNSVFMQYKKAAHGKLTELPQRNVDFGGGLERTVAAVNDSPDIFEIDIYQKFVRKIEAKSAKKYEGENKKYIRIIADHVRASEALISQGIMPSNKLHGYVLRRLIRRSALSVKRLRGNLEDGDLSISQNKAVNKVIEDEVKKFSKTLDRGLKEIEKINQIDAEKAFYLYQTYGFPHELTREIFEEKGQKIDRRKFAQEAEKHKELSRSTSAGVFKGGLADHSLETTKLHTATHLLHEALRRVLGDSVSQRGSHITPERLRFDFSHQGAVSKDEIKKIETLINDQIKKDLKVKKEIMSFDEAVVLGAKAFFKDKYGDRISVYSIGDFSKEVCGGPHVSSTGEVGRVKIVKEESCGSGVRRIYAKIV